MVGRLSSGAGVGGFMLVLLAVAAFGVGRILSLDHDVERYEVNGQPHVERYSALEYLLG